MRERERERVCVCVCVSTKGCPVETCSWVVVGFVALNPKPLNP